ncbi:hypothetical protein NDU88_008392 [Pleurodeles waltl]|uniref:Uncharacterized protein n=1 Tax=Pleurodeles waltl TaxID=8319 RepID=A0AAV7RUL8_PLEWA|nr:hypothetical protein NDU88_008392 [Pleurodeles waltl]
MEFSTGSGGDIVPSEADLEECKVTVPQLGVRPTGFAGVRPHNSPWTQDCTLFAGGDGCPVVVVVVLLVELAVMGGGSSPSPADPDGSPLGLLLLAVVLVAVQVTVLVVVGGGSSPSIAALDSCPLGLLLLAVVLVAVQVALQEVGLAVVGGDSSPSPAASDGCTTMVGGGGSDWVPAPGTLSLLLAVAGPLPLLPAAGAASLPFRPAAGAASLLFRLAAGVDSLSFRLAAGADSLPFLDALVAGTLSVCLAGGWDPFPPGVVGDTTVPLIWVAEVFAWDLTALV